MTLSHQAKYDLIHYLCLCYCLGKTELDLFFGLRIHINSEDIVKSMNFLKLTVGHVKHITCSHVNNALILQVKIFLTLRYFGTGSYCGLV